MDAAEYAEVSAPDERPSRDFFADIGRIKGFAASTEAFLECHEARIREAYDIHAADIARRIR